MPFHEIIETDEGLLLEVEGSPVALLRDWRGNLDLVWQVRGPQRLDQAKLAVMGLLDLLVHYDSKGMTAPARDGRRKKEVES